MSHPNDRNSNLDQAQEAVTRALEIAKQQFDLSGQELAADLMDDLIEHSKNCALKLKHIASDVTQDVVTEKSGDTIEKSRSAITH